MTSEPLDLLVLGGTSWLGGAVARTALERGHRVTCLARGESGEAPEGVTWVRADRRDATAYDEVAARDWDAVVDVSWQPDFVRAALDSLGPRAGHWVYVSSGSVYADDATPDTDEDAPLVPPHQGEGLVDWEVYGEAKVACEHACLSALGADRVLVARAGLIGGYGDRTDRLGYWPARVARADDGEPVLVPPLDTPLQVIDVEDLATWLMTGAEEGATGIFNAVGPRTTVGTVLNACSAATGRTPRYVEASHDWLTEHEVVPWMGPESLPLWLPQPQYAGFMTRSVEAAQRAGLRLRPVEQTVAATLRWESERGLDRERRAGLTAERERLLLELLGSA